MNRRRFLLNGGAATAILPYAQAAPLSRIRVVDIVHHTHTDIGYTELPSVILDLQVRYLDAAIDCCRNDGNFRWTVESLVTLNNWWRRSAPARRDILAGMVQAGRMDVMAMPFNQTPFQNAAQWRQMMNWVPPELWRRLDIHVAMQNDVNGIPRAGAMALLDRGVKHLLMGINSDSGGPPFYRPSAFWWKMPDGRRIFVWLGEHYGSAMNYLKAAREDSRMFDDEQHVRAAHAEFTRRISTIEADGYAFERLILTFTHPRNYDNGGPYPALAPFIAAWNRLELQPRLRLTTATAAVTAMEKATGAKIPEMSGEWTDWWANGDASGPRELAASRLAKRQLAAANSPVFGPMPGRGAAAVEEALRDLCLFDEHTFGSHRSIQEPYSADTLGQYTEKSDLAYRPMGNSDILLRRRVRATVDPMPAGTFAINPTPAPLSGWAGEGEQRFWVQGLGAHSIAARTSVPPTSATPDLRRDSSGWPVAASWSGMPKALFDGSCGGFICTQTVAPADRRTIAGLHAKFDPARRKAAFRESRATYGPATSRETPHTIVIRQEFQHERIARATREIELWRREPRARVRVRFDRISSLAPEVMHIEFAFPAGHPLPAVSSGGVPFTPYRDQLKGACRDYFAIDGWAHYATAEGHWLWATRDAALACIGSPHVVERHTEEPEARHKILAIVFDNCWHTNFVADSHGTFEFQFELAWSDRMDNPADVAEALCADLIARVNPPFHETEEELKYIYRP